MEQTNVGLFHFWGSEYDLQNEEDTRNYFHKIK